MTYFNGADGYCQECGAETEEEWHAYCSGCYAATQGWSQPERAALQAQHDDRQHVTITQLVERVVGLEARVQLLEREHVS